MSSLFSLSACLRKPAPSNPANYAIHLNALLTLELPDSGIGDWAKDAVSLDA
jgi:hypothetical protein